jgi:hypothetical protein
MIKTAALVLLTGLGACIPQNYTSTAVPAKVQEASVPKPEPVKTEVPTKLGTLGVLVDESGTTPVYCLQASSPISAKEVRAELRANNTDAGWHILAVDTCPSAGLMIMCTSSAAITFIYALGSKTPNESAEPFRARGDNCWTNADVSE